MHEEKEVTTTKPQSEETLEPCPWCAIVPVLPVAKPGVWCDHYRVQCGTPNCYGNTQGLSFDTADEALRFWNTRLSPASTAPVVDEQALRDLFDLLKQDSQGQWCFKSLSKDAHKFQNAVQRLASAAATAAPVEQSDEHDTYNAGEC